MGLPEVKKALGLLVGLSFFVAAGINYSQIGPFFPLEAQMKDVSQAWVGVIIGAFDISCFVGSILTASAINPKYTKFIYCFGATISAICVALFGGMGWCDNRVLFIVLCMVIRLVMGAGASLMWATGVSILTPMYPGYAGIITSLIEAFFGIGLVLGPPTGSFVYSLGGYPTPFIATGCVEMLMAVLCIMTLPSREGTGPKEGGEPDKSFAWFCTRLQALLLIAPTVTISGVFGFIDAALAPYLNLTFDIPSQTVGYYFLSFGLSYAVSCILMGSLVDRGWGGKMFLAGSFLEGFGIVALSGPMFLGCLESEIYICSVLVIVSISSSAAYIATYLLFEKMAVSYGFRNKGTIKIVSASVIMCCFSFGRVIGPVVFGGFLMEKQGFYTSSLAMGVLELATAIAGAACLYNNDLIKQIFYETEHDIQDVSETSQLIA